MKKFIIGVFSLLIGSAVFAASLRDYVCVVQPDLSQKNIEFLTQYSETLSNKGYKEYAKDIDAFLKGSFGSGFVFYASNGKPYVVTNRHVLAEGSTATVKFDFDDGTENEYKDLKIVAVDEDIDIGLIELPADFKKAGLKLSKKTVSDGDDVWSAGFPGLGSEPMWQLGKGIVSNSRAKIKELLNPEISTLIQHSAQVDAGNSGGPLMITSAKDESGYEVIGINTWKAVYRENTNYAIPASIINEFVEKSIKSDKEIKAISERIESFNASIKDEDVTYKDMSHYISSEMTREFGSEAFLSILQRASTDVRSYVSKSFMYDPLEGMRYALGFRVWRVFQGEDKVYDYEVKDPVENDGAYEVTFVVNETEYSSTWIYENNYWKLKEFSDIKNKEASAESKKNRDKYGETIFTVSDDYLVDLQIGGLLPKGDLKSGIQLDCNFNVQFFGVGFYYQSEQSNLEIYDSFYEYKGSEKTALRTTGLDVRLQLPLNFTYVLVEPYVTGKIGFVNFMDRYTGGVAPGLDVGIDLALLTFDDFAPEIGVKYVLTKYRKNPVTQRITIYGGIKFLPL